MNRTKRAAKNVFISLIGYGCVVISGFVARTVILKYMGIEMVGIGQLFSNVFMLLSYSSFGLETAIVYSLYGPLQEGDKEKVCAVMLFYKRCFRCMEAAIGILMLILFPLLPFIVKDSSNIQNVYLILLLYGLTAMSSYFYAYKRSIIIADQNRWLSTLFTDVASIIKLIFQIVIIKWTQNYTLYMLTNIVVVFSNMLASNVANRRYAYLKEENMYNLSADEEYELKKNTRAIIGQKLGYVVVFAADSILMSIFLGIDVVGVYANYLIVINGLQAGITIVFQSVTAGIGNLVATEGFGSRNLNSTWETLDFVGFWIYSFSTVCLVVLFHPFIELWIGKNYTFSFVVLLCIALHYYVEGMRKSVITYKDAMGIQWSDRWKPWIEATLNIAFSLLFLYNGSGIEGILIGTILSKLCSSCWIEPYVLYKYGLREKIQIYFAKYIFRIAFLCIMTFVTYMCADYVCGVQGEFIQFLLKLVICMVVPNLVFLLAFFKNEQFRSIVTIVRGIVSPNK